MTPPRARARCLGLILALALLTSGGRAGADRLSPPLEAAIHLKVLGYDRALKKRAGKAVLIVVLFDPSSTASARAKDDIVNAFRSLARRTQVQDLPVAVSAVALQADKLDDGVRGASAIYVTPGLEARLESILALGARTRRPVIGGDRSLARRGVAVAAHPKDQAAGVTINLKAARSAGMDLDSRLFSIAEVLR